MEKQGFYTVTTIDNKPYTLWYCMGSGHWLDEAKNEQVGADGFAHNKKIIKVEFINELK